MSPATNPVGRPSGCSETDEDRRATSTVASFDSYVIGERTNDAEPSPGRRPRRCNTPLGWRRHTTDVGPGHAEVNQICTDGHLHIDVVGGGMFESVRHELTHDQAGVRTRRRPAPDEMADDEAARRSRR